MVSVAGVNQFSQGPRIRFLFSLWFVNSRFTKWFIAVFAESGSIEQEIDSCQHRFDVAVFLGSDVTYKIVKWTIFSLPRKLKD